MDINEVEILLVEDNPTDAQLEIRELRQAQIKFEVKCVDTRTGNQFLSFGKNLYLVPITALWD